MKIIQECISFSWEKRPSIQDLLFFLESQQHSFLDHSCPKDLEIMKLKEIIKEQNEIIEKLKLEINKQSNF
jgi:hypothetical protein